MDDDENREQISEMRYNLLVEKFEQIFKIKGYNSNSNFDNKVWFLKEDDAFNSVAFNNTPYENPKENSKMIEILNELNQNSDLKDLTIVTNQFISKICQTINDANNSIEISEKSIKKNDILKKIAKINETLSRLENNIENKKKGEFHSNLQSTLISMKNFPSGEYQPCLVINTDFDKEKLSDLNQTEIRNLDKHIDDNVYKLFKEKKLYTRGKINIPNPLNYIDFNKPIANTLITEQINSFDDYDFQILNIENRNYLVDKRNSGTTFSNFKIVINGQDKYECNNQYILHILLTSIEELCDTNNDSISKTLSLKLKGPNENEAIRNVLIKFDITFDPLTRSGILNRIKNLISVPIDDKSNNRYMIEQLLTDYFPDIKDACINILKRTTEERKDCCTIF